MNFVRLKEYWEISPLKDQIQFRSPNGSFSLFLGEDETRTSLIEALRLIASGTTIKNLRAATTLNKEDLASIINVLNEHGVISGRAIPESCTRSLTLDEMVRSIIKLDSSVIINFPESGGVKKLHRIAMELSNKQLLVYGFRFNDRYYVCGYDGSGWLEPKRFAHETLRDLQNQEDMPYSWMVTESDVWPFPELYFPLDRAEKIAAKIHEILPQIAGCSWVIMPGNCKKISPRFQGRSLTEKVRPPIETEFVGKRSIIAETHSIRVATSKSKAFFVSHSRSTVPHLASDGTGLAIWNWGEDKKRSMAKLKSTMEGIERYSSGHYNLEALTFGSWKELSPKAIHPKELCLYEPRPNSNLVESFCEDDKVHWCRAVAIVSGEERLIPVDYVYYPLSREELGRDRLFFANSSGVAAHTDKKVAIDAALAELCEREAIMVHWYNQTSPTKITHESLSEEVRERIVWIENLGYKVLILDLRLDLIPVVMALALGNNGKRALTIGAAAATTYAVAAKKSISEISTIIALEERNTFERARIDRKDVDLPEDHGRFYAFPENLLAVSCWLNGEVSLPLPEGEWQIRETLRKRNLDTYMIDLTPEEVRESRSSVSVIRAIIPGMVPISFGYGFHPFGLRRLKCVAQWAHSEHGLKLGTILSADNIHPFS